VIISGQTAGNFVVSDSVGTAQIVCGTIEELLDRAVRYVDAQHAGLWCLRDDQTYAAVIDPALLRRMWSEFVEMPGVRLTRAQAQRLWGVNTNTCLSALETLVVLKALVCTTDGKYARPSMVRSADLFSRAC
jgi:hypothetical protein